MQNQPEPKSSSTPILIIIVALVAIGALAWYFYSSSQTTTPVANTAGTTAANGNRNAPAPAATPARPVNAPSGAPLGVNMTGAPTATVTLEEFADYQCGACAIAHPVMRDIKGIYGDRIKFVFRNFPLPMHNNAYNAAVAVEAAGFQGKYWAMQDQMFTNQAAWAAPGADFARLIAEYAAKVGLDPAKFQNDMDGRPAKDRIDADLARGKGLGVSSTPTLYVNGQMIPYQELRVDSLRRIIDAEFAAASGGANTSK